MKKTNKQTNPSEDTLIITLVYRDNFWCLHPTIDTESSRLPFPSPSPSSSDLGAFISIYHNYSLARKFFSPRFALFNRSLTPSTSTSSANQSRRPPIVERLGLDTKHFQRRSRILAPLPSQTRNSNKTARIDGSHFADRRDAALWACPTRSFSLHWGDRTYKATATRNNRLGRCLWRRRLARFWRLANASIARIEIVRVKANV